jgi:microcystin-dependent protein
LEANQANLLVSTYANEGGIVYQGSSNPAQLAIGTAGQVLKVNSGETAPEWGQITAAGIATDAVTSDKILNGTIALGDLAAAVANRLVPVGTISAYAGATAPTGWLLCNGASTTGYTALAALVGATTPDLQGHVLVGKGSAPFDGALLSKFGSTTSTASHTHGSGGLSANTGGSHDHTFAGTVNAETQDHSHGQLVAGFNLAPTGVDVVVTGPGGGVDASYSTGGKSTTHNHTISVTTGSHGGHGHSISGDTGASSAGSTHGNVQPSALVNFIIKHD